MAKKSRSHALQKRGKRPGGIRRGKGRGTSWFRRWKDLLPSGGLSVSRTVFLGIAGLSLILLGVAILRTGGILDLLRLTERVSAMRAEMTALEDENGRLRAQVRRLRNEPQEIERIARDVLGLVRPGETVYEFIEKD